MATVILRGAVAGEAAVDCIYSGIVTMVGFAAFGYGAGAIMDYLVCQDLENQYRRRLDWFRKEFEAFGGEHATQDQPKGPDA